jgi:hypothetical protein
MANRDLLKEAIADAKSVKEAAIANAKAALEEAFTPYLQEKFVAKLAEMELEEEEIEERNKYGGNDGNIPASKRGDKTTTAEEEGVRDYEKRVKEEDGDIDEINLEELLAELDEELVDEEEVDESSYDVEETLNEAEEEEESKEEEVEGGDEEEEFDLEDMSEEELKDLIEDVIVDMVRAGELEAGDDFEDEEEEGKEEMKMDSEEEETLDEIYDIGLANIGNTEAVLAMLAGFIGVPVASLLYTFKKEGIEAIKKLVSKKKVQEITRDAEFEELASTLSEVKLLNAKLLYTNKIFRAKNLTEGQKVKVLESFDKATTVKEAKVIYETLSSVKEAKSKPVVTEALRGLASKAVGVAPEKKPILEVNNQFTRWQKLAGIK